MKGSKLGIRLLYYFGGFFVMTIGIALSVKSNLGVSPVSSIPYTMTCVWGLQHARGDISIDGQPDYPFADVLDCHCFRCNRHLFLRSGGHYAAGR